MALRIRHLLLWLTAIGWLAASWRFLLGSPDFDQLGAALLDRRFAWRWSEFQIAGWFLGMLGAMVLVDRLYCRFLVWRWGVDPMTMHWSRLRNRRGDFFCAACGSVFMLPPADFSDEGWAHCGDCGHAVAPYGEMKPLLRYRGREGLARLARYLRR